MHFIGYVIKSFIIINSYIYIIDKESSENEDEEESFPQIKLFSDDVSSYMGDLLTLILPRIMNPRGNII